MMSIYSAALPLLLLLSNHHHVQGNDSFSEVAANHRAADEAYNTMLREYLDEDENCPPGPPEGWPHTEPFSYTPEAQLEYTNMVNEDMQTQYQQLNQLELNTSSTCAAASKLPKKYQYQGPRVFQERLHQQYQRESHVHFVGQ